MSLITVMPIGKVCIERTAVSRPDPAPLTFTSNCLTPWSKSFFIRDSTELCAAKGVLFLAPLNPQVPEDDQATTLPLKSVTETIDETTKMFIKN